MAKKQLIDTSIEIDEASLKKLQKTIPKGLDIASTRTVERLMERVEKVSLITEYTQTSRPAKPTGSTYIRTFRLQHSSQKQILRDTLPVEGQWEAKTKYASGVIGFSNEQAPIHKGRWPSFDTVIRSLKIMDQRFFDEEVERLQGKI